MELHNQSCSSGRLLSVRPFVLRGKNFDTVHNAQTFQKPSLIPAVLVGLCHFLPLLVIFTMTGVTQRKFCWFHLSHTFQTDGTKSGVVMKHSD